MKPTTTMDQIDVLDLIRGFALIGLPFVNVLALWSSSIHLSGKQSDIWIQRFLYIFIEGRFYAIFSFLFGVGFWIFLSRAKEKNNRPYPLFIRRMAILFFFGVIHQIINPGEALLVYAIFGMLVLLFYKAPKQVNLILGIAGVIIGSFFGVKLLLPLPLILLGLAFGQYHVFESYAKNKKKWLAVFILSFIATIALTVFLWQNAPDAGLSTYIEGHGLTEAQAEGNRSFYEFADLSMLFSTIFSIFYISSLVVLEPLARKWLSPLKSFGRMALTNYIGQSIILVGILAFVPAGALISYLTATITCAIVVGVQIIFSSLWLRVFKYGPLEWLWRCGTYGKWISIKGK
ncbi:DUF418 domain-containing protein [Sporosarcina sp. FSL K6-3508]|uniref:DUF418 domain-containing protein n=1 Tax=Sporosarcina sp. FSL K6-3508 TaxID=2921557 RepID=UPI00315A1D2E